jgi:phosphoserine phosphatase RsbU/P
VMNSSFFVGPFRMQWHYPGLLLFAFTVAWVLTRRFTEDSHQREQLEAEVRAAKEVQDLLLAGSGPAVEGFAIDSAYLPAADLGGDFFQALPARDGGLLLVVGDVSGKGLRAAMLAGVVIGAIRTAVDPSPAALLRHLNGALAGRSGEGFVTCCVCLLRPDGELLVANAGHIPPYCDGKPIDTPGGLPLGIVAEMDWDQVETRLDAGRTLVLLSDGVLEATNSNQEMLGFDGLEAALATKPSASDLANLARNFGQEDDITVLAVSRTLAAAQVA